MPNINATPSLPPVPYSAEAEEAVLGSILVDPECIGEVAGILHTSDFYHEKNQFIYSAMVAIRERGGLPNIVLVGTELQSNGNGFLISTLPYLVSIVPTSMDAAVYAKEVVRFSFYRQLIQVSSNIAVMAVNQNSDIAGILDKCDDMIDHLRNRLGPGSRHLELGKPRMIQTNPPRYIWNVNGKDLRLTLGEITQWGRFKNRVIAELNFVPDRPKNWDDTINDLITHSYLEAAPIDANEEQQLKIIIQGWFERRREATVLSDVKAGMHTIREVKGTSYYFFQSTPLLDYLKKEYKRGISSEDLWVYCDKWGGIRHEVRIKSGSGTNSMPLRLWGLPLDFTSAEIKATMQPPNDF